MRDCVGGAISIVEYSQGIVDGTQGSSSWKMLEWLNWIVAFGSCYYHNAIK